MPPESRPYHPISSCVRSSSNLQLPLRIIDRRVTYPPGTPKGISDGVLELHHRQRRDARLERDQRAEHLEATVVKHLPRHRGNQPNTQLSVEALNHLSP
jgi:hypothetical protein